MSHEGGGRLDHRFVSALLLTFGSGLDRGAAGLPAHERFLPRPGVAIGLDETVRRTHRQLFAVALEHADLERDRRVGGPDLGNLRELDLGSLGPLGLPEGLEPARGGGRGGVGREDRRGDQARRGDDEHGQTAERPRGIDQPAEFDGARGRLRPLDGGGAHGPLVPVVPGDGGELDGGGEQAAEVGVDPLDAQRHVREGRAEAIARRMRVKSQTIAVAATLAPTISRTGPGSRSA